MNARHGMPLIAAALLLASGCEADEEPFEQGADLEPPAAVEQAPITDDVGPQRLEDDINAGAPAGGPPLQEVPLDTVGGA